MEMPAACMQKKKKAWRDPGSLRTFDGAKERKKKTHKESGVLPQHTPCGRLPRPTFFFFKPDSSRPPSRPQLSLSLLSFLALSILVGYKTYDANCEGCPPGVDAAPPAPAAERLAVVAERLKIPRPPPPPPPPG